MTLNRISEVSTYVSASAAVTFWGLSASELAVLISATFAGLSFAVHLYVSLRRDRRETEAHRLKMEEDDHDEADTGGSSTDP